MSHLSTIKINFRGGIISPGELYKILTAAERVHVNKVSFGLRQQLFIKIKKEYVQQLEEQLQLLNISFEKDEEVFPNVVSSYPAEEVFINNTWLSEGVYKDIFDLMEYQPKLKINISDSNQSFTPLLTGNINWVASLTAQHFWHVFIRFPKTNTIYEWDQLVYTNDLARMSRHIETLIFEHSNAFYDNHEANGNTLFKLVCKENYILKPADAPANLPLFNLPYYEGLNRYQNKYWLGIYRRDELFSVNFLKEMCQICSQTKIGQICSTPWKSIIVKGIEEKDRLYWNSLLAKHQINVRHAANELNFQVEDNCPEGLALKNYLLAHLHKNDTRTFGICIGIKTRSKSEVFSSILVRRRPLIHIGKLELFHVYDILCAKDFNPNKRTGFVYSKRNSKKVLAEKLQMAIFSFYTHKDIYHRETIKKNTVLKESIVPVMPAYVYQCPECFSVYDEKIGEPENNIPASTSFDNLPKTYCCNLCEAPKSDFVKIDKSKLNLQPV